MLHYNVKVINRILKFVNSLIPTPLDTQATYKLVLYITANPSSATTPDEITEYVMRQAIGFYNLLYSNKISPPLDIKETLNELINDLASTSALLSTEQYSIRQINNKLNHIRKINSIQSFLGETDIYKIAHTINPQSQYRKVYLALDTKYAKFLENQTKLQWNYHNTIQEFGNSTNTVGPLENIVSMRIYSFVVQYFNSPLNRATVLVNELSAQSFLWDGDKNFHFMARRNSLLDSLPLTDRTTITLDYQYVPDIATANKIELLSGYRFNEGIYYFNPPVTLVDTITLSIRDPTNLLHVPKFIIDVQVTNVDLIGTVPGDLTDPVVIADTGEILIDTILPHYVTTLPDETDPPGQIPVDPRYKMLTSLKFINFTTDTPIADSEIIEYFNTNEFTTIEVVSTTQLRVRPRYIRPQSGRTYRSIYNNITWGGPTWVLQGNILPCQIQLDSYRIVVNIEFTTLPFIEDINKVVY
jgi:hypothetical protein